MAQPAQFDTNVPMTGGALNVPAPRPVQNDATADLIGTLGQTALNVADTAQRSLALGVAAQQKAAVQGAVATYSTQVGQLQQAVAQGVMSSSAARTRIRALRNQVISNNPSALPEVDAATSAFLSDSGLGSDIVKGTDAEQQEAKTVSQMASEGWSITPNMPETDKQELINAWQQQKLAQQQLQITAQQIAVTRGKLGITSDQLGIQGKRQSLVTGAITQQTDQLNLQNKLHQTNANQAIFNGASAWTTNFASKMQAITQSFNNSGKTPADQQAAIDQVNMELAQITSNASKAGIGGDQSVIDQAVAPMKALASATTGFINGKVETQGYADAVTNSKNQSVLLAMHGMSPSDRAMIGLMSTSAQMSASLANTYGDPIAMRVAGRFTQPATNPDGTPAKMPDVAVGRDDPDYGSIDGYLKDINTAITKANVGTLDDKGQQILNTSLTNMMNGIVGGGANIKSPGDYNRVIQFLADPAVNAYVASHPNVMRTGYSSNSPYANVSDLLSAQIKTNIMPAVMNEWTEATTNPRNFQFTAGGDPMSGSGGSFSVDTTPTPNAVHPEFTGGGIRFVANDPSNPKVQSTVADLNQRLAPLMGRLIRASATTEGTTNYRKVWNEDYAHWFDSPEESFKRGLNTPATEPKSDKASPQLMGALFQAESNGDNTAVSSKGAISVGQLLPATAQALGYSTDDLKDPAVAKEASTKYMNMMLDRFDGNVKLALAAYNYGPTNVAKLVKKYGDDYASIEQHLPQETRDYVPKVINGVSGG